MTQQTLRETINLSTSEIPLWVHDIIANVRLETVERCELAQVELTWRTNKLSKEIILSIYQSIALVNIIREAVSNALRHADPSKIEITLSYKNTALIILIKNDGHFSEL